MLRHSYGCWSFLLLVVIIYYHITVVVLYCYGRIGG